MVIAGFVLDASVTAAWCFKNEASEKSTALLRSLRNTKAVVPRLWHFETANMLCQAERRRRITAQESLTAVEFLALLPIETDPEAERRAHGAVLALARQHRLTPYDAAYLDLAIRRRLPLATRDRDLQRTARSCKVELIET